MNSPGLLLPHRAAGGGCVSLFLPEHLSLGGVGSYFWSLGTRVGGSDQLPLQYKSLTTRPPLREPTVPLESAQGEGDMSQT